ncbi:hypothetical protein L873DRAFT_1243149 [Choiromyces venosus 120613-1]|uniref:Uncharacterized protein n=1 Tax=Choiromyces venosus 120613-1 TaxID=1336337 RepID=A0A3N4JHU8_9PEZI|nr:hypothetical protein L873DRAFT_1243149 [Choiromyces venosus 120613-1]
MRYHSCLATILNLVRCHLSSFLLPVPSSSPLVQNIPTSSTIFSITSQVFSYSFCKVLLIHFIFAFTEPFSLLICGCVVSVDQSCVVFVGCVG